MNNAILTNTRAIPIEEFLAYDRDHDGRFEYINGEWVEKMATILTHSYVMKALLYVFMEMERLGLGEFFVEATFILQEKPRWVKGSRIPDVMFYTNERSQELKASPNWRQYPATIIPNIVIEVVSPSDDAEKMVEKAALYLEDGVESVWLVWMDSKRVDIYTPNSDVPQVIEGENAILSGAPLLPQFEIPLNQLFTE